MLEQRLTARAVRPGQRRQPRIRRRRGGLLLDWLDDQPGQTWQERWLASGADAAGADWRQVPAGWLRGTAIGSAPWQSARCASAVTVAIGADLMRPSLAWLAAGATGQGALVRGMAQAVTRGVRAAAAAVRRRPRRRPPRSATPTLHRSAVILAAKGGTLADVTVGDVLELLDAEHDVHTRRGSGTRACSTGCCTSWGSSARPRRRRCDELRTAGQRTPEQLIDRYRSGLPAGARPAGGLPVRTPTGAGLHQPRIAGRLPGRPVLGRPGTPPPRHRQPAPVRRRRRRVEAAAAHRSQDGHRRTGDGREDHDRRVERINYRQCLTPVRAFYLDLAQWAVEDPARWAPWVAPCPIGEEEIDRRKASAHRKSRMDARTRERLPVLPVLVAQRRPATPGQPRPCWPPPARPGPGRRSPPPDRPSPAGHPAHPHRQGLGRRPGHRQTPRPRPGGRPRVLGLGRSSRSCAPPASGSRNCSRLTHHSLVQYRLPGTGELVPLLQIAPSKTDAERLLVISPELADVLATIIRRIRGTDRGRPARPGLRPPRMRLAGTRAAAVPTPRRHRAPRDLRRHASANLLNTALAHTGLTDPATATPLRFTPHDFRRIFITDAILTGLPPHIAQIIAGHRDINVTMGYKAVYPDEAINAHRAFLARRRALRPSEEYRVPTDEEWQEFLGHFERRKVSIGTCGRAFGTPCIHEHACIRCPLLWPDPAQRDRLVEIRDNLTARIAEAEREGWLGEVEGLQVSLAGAEDKLAQLDRRSRRTTTVDLGIPAPARTF